MQAYIYQTFVMTQSGPFCCEAILHAHSEDKEIASALLSGADKDFAAFTPAWILLT
jgi:hypothetical protein